MKSAQIRSISSYVPSTTLKNEELVSRFSGWTIEKIVHKLGIEERPIAAVGETATDMAEKAVRAMFDSGSVRPEEIDFLILCTQSPDYFLPTSACILQDRLGIPQRSGALDFNLGCSGYVYGLALVKGLIETGVAENVLLVTSETYSKYINENDRVSRPLFGDGAAATLIRAVSLPDDAPSPIGPFVFGTDGSRADMLIVPAGAHRLPSSSETSIEKPDGHGSVRSKDQLFMHGAGIFAFALDTIPLLVDELLAKSGLTRDDIGCYVFHQANRFMLDRLRNLCHLDETRFFNDIRKLGNTVSSSIPIAIQDAQRAGMISPNTPVMLIGFGVGLSWAGTIVRFSDSICPIQ